MNDEEIDRMRSRLDEKVRRFWRVLHAVLVERGRRRYDEAGAGPLDFYETAKDVMRLIGRLRGGCGAE